MGLGWFEIKFLCQRTPGAWHLGDPFSGRTLIRVWKCNTCSYIYHHLLKVLVSVILLKRFDAIPNEYRSSAEMSIGFVP